MTYGKREKLKRRGKKHNINTTPNRWKSRICISQIFTYILYTFALYRKIIYCCIIRMLEIKCSDGMKLHRACIEAHHYFNHLIWTPTTINEGLHYYQDRSGYVLCTPLCLYIHRTVFNFTCQYGAPSPSFSTLRHDAIPAAADVTDGHNRKPNVHFQLTMTFAFSHCCHCDVFNVL